MSATAFGWLVLIFPLAGSIVIGLGYRRWSGRTAGWIGTGAIALAFASAIGAFVVLLGEPDDARQLTSTAWDYATSVGPRHPARDPGRPALGRDVPGRHAASRCSSTCTSTAYMVSDQGYARFFAYLNFFVFSMLLLVLAGNFVLLVVGWAFVGFASYALISYWYRRSTATTAGMKAFVINVIGDIGLVLAAFLIFRELGAFDYLTVFEEAPSPLRPRQRHDRRDLPPPPGRRVRQVRPAAAPHLAARRDGRPHPGLRPDPRGDDGHRGRLPDRAHAPPLRAGSDRRRHRRVRRSGDADRRGDHRARSSPT